MDERMDLGQALERDRPAQASGADAETAGSPAFRGVGAQTVLAAPTLSLAQGGGAIRGIGETFETHPVTGTATLTVPIATSPARGGFGPTLALRQDSGSGNGLFGWGWTLALPLVARRTDKGIPRYLDDEESDLFVLDGEELVPGASRLRKVAGVEYRVRRYRPRVEQRFDRIERWTRVADGVIHWRTISAANVTSVYGTGPACRIEAADDGRRIFAWLVAESFDDRGNTIEYEYVADDARGVDTAAGPERRRDDACRARNRYPKRIRYGNAVSRLDPGAAAAVDPWHFEIVFDYGEHDPDRPRPDDHRAAGARAWDCRPDAFSTGRPGFELRTHRRCRRVLMFHHFSDEPGVGRDCLVRSTDLEYDAGSGYSLLRSITSKGYRRREGGYVVGAWPALECRYRAAQLNSRVQTVAGAALQNLPAALTGLQWVDLDGEGIAGALLRAPGAWYYKRNRSAAGFTFAPDGSVTVAPAFGDLECLSLLPAPALADAAALQLTDLDGDGLPELASFGPATSGFFERTAEQGWGPRREFACLPQIDWGDPNLRFVDLTGDGRADLLIAEDGVAFVWHRSLGKAGYGVAERVLTAADEERAPRLVFADGRESIFLADMSGDGLADIVRVRHAEVCYWPNLGHGRFGPKVTMALAEAFDREDRFDPARLRLADLDGTGPCDIVYLRERAAAIHFNRSGNALAAARLVETPPPAPTTTVQLADLLGTGTTCLVFSSTAEADRGTPLRYIDLFGGRKPLLLESVDNNLGAETRVRHAPSTSFRQKDEAQGRPWVGRLPFVLHVVEQVETIDHVGGHRFVSRYAYHHGHNDAAEHEFRGFGMVEQWDSESVTMFGGAAPVDLPPVLTRRWFHTGLAPEAVARTGSTPTWPGAECLIEAAADLAEQDRREAPRALKGLPLREEVFLLDGSERAARPCTVTEHRYWVRCLQPGGGSQHAVFLPHAAETLTTHQERAEADPRIEHALTLAFDDHGNALRSLAVAYGREPGCSPLDAAGAAAQQHTWATCAESRFTNVVDDDDAYRVPMPAEVCTWELSGFAGLAAGQRVELLAWAQAGAAWLADAVSIGIGDNAGGAAAKRLVALARTVYRPDDLGCEAGDAATLLPLGTLQSRALAGERHDLAFTEGWLSKVLQRDGAPLLPDPAAVLAVDGGGAGDRGGYVAGATLVAAGVFPATDEPGTWWRPGGRVFLSPGRSDSAADERAHALAHFFQPCRYRDAFHGGACGTETVVTFDRHDLLVAQTEDALGNLVSAGARDPGAPSGHDYVVLQPWLVSDANGNCSAIAHDAHGLVCGSAWLSMGDTLDGFEPELDATATEALFCGDDLPAVAATCLAGASTRFVNDMHRFRRTRAVAPDDPARWQAPALVKLARETHGGAGPGRVQAVFSYVDGFGREVQKKSAAAPGPLVDGGANGSPRWIASGCTVRDRRGQPLRTLEPFFTGDRAFEALPASGVGAVQLRDPDGRVVATLHPDGSYEKLVHEAWQRTRHDRNDTVAARGSATGDPRTDADIGALAATVLARWPGGWRGWAERRTGGVLGPAQAAAAQQAALHADTPRREHLDALGRVVVTELVNRSPLDDAPADERLLRRVTLDAAGHACELFDELGRLAMRYRHDLLGRRLHESGMDGGDRWMLSDAADHPLRAWSGRGFARRHVYDALRRPCELYVDDRLVERQVYGEAAPAGGNLRQRVWRRFDGAGVVTHEAYDARGRLLASRRELVPKDAQGVDWRTPPTLQDSFGRRMAYDALDRPTSVATPDASEWLPAYDEGGGLVALAVRLRGAAVATGFVDAVEYDPLGRRLRLQAASGAVTRYEYDPESARLVRLRSTRPAAAGGAPASLFVNDGLVQDLVHVYDPVGNLTQVNDGAMADVAHGGENVVAQGEFAYDALYRLVSASGREHIGQTTFDLATANPDRRDVPFVGAAHPNDLQALRRYVERYRYDGAGNLLALEHRCAGGSWTRRHEYGEASLLEPQTQHGNRLTRTVTGNGVGWPPETCSYVDAAGRDLQGCVAALGSLALQWDCNDRLAQADLGGGGTLRCTYDAAGRRVRKCLWRLNGSLQREWIDLDGFEICREYGGDGLTLQAERETLHVTAGGQRLALVETTVADAGAALPAPAPRVCYQLSDHLGSVRIVLDAAAAFVAGEEFHPYGTSALQVSGTGAPARRHRFMGQQRDEETGLACHGARYYVPWCARWLSPDPGGVADGLNPYLFVQANPLCRVDRTGLQGSAFDQLPPFMKAKILSGQADDRTSAMVRSATASPFARPDPGGERKTGLAAVASGITLGVGETAVGMMLYGTGFDIEGHFDPVEMLLHNPGINPFALVIGGLEMIVGTGVALGEGMRELVYGDDTEKTAKLLTEAGIGIASVVLAGRGPRGATAAETGLRVKAPGAVPEPQAAARPRPVPAKAGPGPSLAERQAALSFPEQAARLMYEVLKHYGASMVEAARQAKWFQFQLETWLADPAPKRNPMLEGQKRSSLPAASSWRRRP